MQEIVGTYLYQPNLGLEIIILLAIFCLFSKPVYLTALMSALLLLRPNERFDCLVSYPKIIFPIMALSLVFYSSKKVRNEQFKIDKFLLYFIVIIAVETILRHREDLARNAYFIIVGLVLYFAAVRSSTSLKGATLLSCSTVISCFLICGEAVFYHYNEEVGSQIWTIFHDGLRLQAWMNWGNANETAFLACIGAVNIVFLLFRFRTKILFFLSATLIMFFSLVVFLTASRAGLASLVLIFMPLVILLDSMVGKFFVVIVVLAVLLLSSSYTPQRLDSQASSTARFDLRYEGERLFLENPFLGVGFKRSRNDTGGQPLHNTYLQALAETGLLGALFLFYYLFAMGKRIYTVARIIQARGLPRVNIAVVSGFYASSLFYFLWANQLLSLLFFLTIAQITVWLHLVENDVQANAIAVADSVVV